MILDVACNKRSAQTIRWRQVRQCEEILRDLRQALRDADKELQETEVDIGQLRDLVGLVSPPPRGVRTQDPRTYTTFYDSSSASSSSHS
jgi:hypothetical protein